MFIIFQMSVLLEYLSSGIESANALFETIVNEPYAFSLREALVEQHVKLLDQHQVLSINSSGYKKSMLRDCIIFWVQKFPENTYLLNMFAKSQRNERIENRVAIVFDKLCKTYALPSDVVTILERDPRCCGFSTCGLQGNLICIMPAWFVPYSPTQ